MSTLHTPGPWQALWDEDDGFQLRMGTACLTRHGKPTTDGTGVYPHAHLTHHLIKLAPGAENLGPKATTEAQANFQLMSAAPDLLAALADLIPLIAAEYPAQQETWLAEARAAIAKAREAW